VTDGSPIARSEDLAGARAGARIAARLRAAGSVFAEEEAELLVSATDDPTVLASMVARRVAGEPVEAIVEWASFCGLRIAVVPGVFVPRRRTELLAREARRIARNEMHQKSASEGAFRSGLSGQAIVELCCGTAAVATAILDGMGGSADELELHVADVDPRATTCARENLGGRGQVHTGDLYDALPADLRGRIDVLVANAPYVPTAEISMMPPEARDHEPHVALDGGTDGLDVQRRIIERAHAWLTPGGHLLVETSRRQAAGTVAACEAVGLVTRVVTDDDLDATAVVGRRP
jgi:release factor glutamine methyltransferase